MSFAQFGPAGNPDSFYNEGHKASFEMPSWLAKMNLTAYEYQCSRGVTIREETARNIGMEAKKNNISLSIHAPYYINLSTEDETTAANTCRHFFKSLQVAAWMGADRITFHIGGPGKQIRSAALTRAAKLFRTMLEEAETMGLLGNVLLAPETMGKRNQLGSLEEVVEFCKLSKYLIPTIDFGHLHAVTGGEYTTEKEYEQAFDLVANELGNDIAARIHVHFSRIEFTKAGEKKHWTFKDNFGPPFEPFINVIAKRGYTPRIICESAGSQTEDAEIMQDYYLGLLKNK